MRLRGRFLCACIRLILTCATPTLIDPPRMTPLIFLDIARPEEPELADLESSEFSVTGQVTDVAVTDVEAVHDVVHAKAAITGNAWCCWRTDRLNGSHCSSRMTGSFGFAAVRLLTLPVGS